MKFVNYHKTRCFILIVFACSLTAMKAQQNFSGKIIDFKKTEIRISEILSEIADQGITYSYKYIFSAEDRVIKLTNSKLSLNEVLELMVKQNAITYKVENGHIIIKPKIIKHFKVSGFIYCKSTGEQLIAANVYNPGTLAGTLSNNYGFYSFSHSEKLLKIKYTFCGYKPFEISLNSEKDTIINIYLEPDNILKEVTITDINTSLLKSSQASSHKLSLKSIQSQTLFFGEKDVLKTIQLLPGIQPTLEGSTGLQVRGGSHSQNLIMIDDVPIYNIDHAFGFFSIFNADAIKSVQMYKGAFPARFGGGVSSVIDIRMNEGNNEHFQFEFSTGTILSKIKIEGPIIKHKTGFMISARRTHLNLPLKIYKSNKNPGLSENYSFGDIYAKINHRFSEKSRIFLSCFIGNDKYETSNKSNIDSTNLSKEYKSNLNWNNFAVAARWNYLFSDKFFVNSTITYGGYRYSHKKNETVQYQNIASEKAMNEKDTNYYSGIKDIGFKVDFDLPVNEKHYIRFGINSGINRFQPFMEGSLVMVSKKSENLLALPEFDINYDTLMSTTNIQSYNLSAYFENDMDITAKLKTNLGFRYNVYYCNDKVYRSLEPRISMRYIVLSDLSIKAGYSKISQNVHLLSSSFLVLPFNVWVPSNDKVKPLISDQYSLSFNYNFKNILDISLEGFYKTIQNDILYKSGNTAYSSWESFIEQGERRSYGLEFMIDKQMGKFSGWFTYTLSRTERKFESVNNGDYFPYWLVRKHKISATLNYKLNKFVDFGASWVFSSGVSGNSGYQELAPILFQQSRNNNNSRDSWTLINKIPAYHKLDIGANLHLQTKRMKHNLSLGINNAYARNNPLLISEYEGYLYLSKINLFMPFVQYSLSF